MEVGANLGLASVDHVIERLIMTVIETCSVGAVVCVSKKKRAPAAISDLHVDCLCPI